MKELYFFDQLHFNEMVNDHKFLLKSLNELAAAYSGIGLKEPFSKQIMIESISDTPAFVKRLKNALIASMELMKLPKVLMESVEQGANERLNEIAVKAQAVYSARISSRQFSQYAVMVDFNLYEVDKSGQVVLPESSMEILRDRASIWITTENQNKAVKIMEEINQKFDEIRAVLRENGILNNVCTDFRAESGALVWDGEHYKLKPGIVQRLK